jgi:hypothetical protein
MTTANETPANGAESATKPVLEFWTRYFEQASEQTQALLGTAREACDPVALRREWLAGLAEGLDHYLRTPAFLETMRRNFEMMTQLRGTSEDLCRDFSRASGIPRINDISGLFERMRIGQEAILARLEAIEARLIALEPKRKNTHA